MKVIAILSLISSLSLFLSCSSEEPVSTQYKKQLAEGESGGGTGSDNVSDGGTADGGGGDTALIEQGVALYTSLNCASCHEAGVSGAGPLVESGVWDQAMIEGAQAVTPLHASLAWPAGGDAAALAAAFTIPE